jgi:hypothetical protein
MLFSFRRKDCLKLSIASTKKGIAAGHKVLRFEMVKEKQLMEPITYVVFFSLHWPEFSNTNKGLFYWWS